MPRFSATIYKLGINPVVDPPERVLNTIFKQAGRTKGPIPVRGKVNGAEFRQTLVKYGGAWRLYINEPMLKDSGLTVGEMAKIDLQYDGSPPQVGMLKQFAEALDKDWKAREAFEKLTPSRQKEILKYLASLKTTTSIERNIGRVLDQLSK